MWCQQKDWRCAFEEIPTGKGRMIKDGSELAILSIGPVGYTVEQILEKDTQGKIALYDMRFVKPLDAGMLRSIAGKFDKIITIEDGVIEGGMGSAVLEYLADNGFDHIRVKRMGLPDSFVEHGPASDLHKICHIDKDSIIRTIKELISIDL